MAAPQQPMLARRQLRLAALDALNAVKTSAQIAVIDSPGDWNTPPEKLPAILLRNGREQKVSITKGMPEFTTTVTLEIEARVDADTAAVAQDCIEALGYLIENTLLCDYSVISMVNQVASVESETEITSDGRRHFGAMKMAVSFEMPEMFDPTEAPVAASAWPQVVHAAVPLTSIGLHADMLGTFSPTGTFTPSADAPAYAATPSPRTAGPDGRDEVALDIQLPQ